MKTSPDALGEPVKGGDSDCHTCIKKAYEMSDPVKMENLTVEILLWITQFLLKVRQRAVPLKCFTQCLKGISHSPRTKEKEREES